MSVKSLTQDFINYEKSLNLRDKTIAEYVRGIERFADWLKEELKLSFLLDSTIAKVDHATAQDYTFSLRELKSKGGRELAHASAKKEIVSVQEFYKFLMTKRLVSVNPFREVKIAKDVVTPERRFLKVSEGFDIVKSIDSPIENLRLSILANMGLRVGELVALEVKNFNLEKGTVTFLRKNQEWQTLTIPKTIRKELTVQVEMARHNGQTYLFENKSTGKHITTMAVTKNFKKASAKLGLDSFSPHALRKVCANNMKLNYGFETEQIREVLNHKSIATTDIYLSAKESGISDKMANM